ncbi:MAG TPA: hypothetical protein VK530_00700, partial [Candidatus Acidoferrum sp.]|nr:hypothetical protein [Candidatus Acidoferrum sp.]
TSIPRRVPFSHSGNMLRPRYRIRELDGRTFIPQVRMWFRWHNLASGFSSFEAARKRIRERLQRGEASEVNC